jgi:response regulator RpfG family c-di-GMP phosphodiesterase
VAVNVSTLSQSTGLPSFVIFLFVNIVLNIPDKAVSLLAALLLIRFIPEKAKEQIKGSSWRQRALTDREKKIMREWVKGNKHSVRTKMTFILMGMSFILVVAIFWVGVRIYLDNMLEERTNVAESTASLASELIPIDSIDSFIREGKKAEKYKKTEDMLGLILKKSSNVDYLAAVKISESGMTVICRPDIESDGEIVTGDEPGTFLTIPEYALGHKSELLKGEKIEPIPVKIQRNMQIVVFHPVLNERGNSVCYIITEAHMDYMTKNMRDYLTRIMFMMAGLFFLTLMYGFFITGANLVYPITSIVLAVEKFISAGSEQKKMDEALKLIRSLDISTDDEVEKLYYSISDMAANQTEQMRSLRRYTEATSKMQDGLIITMADLVENRDSDTGAHIQKMAAYVKIIVEGLKKKGYYAEKITPQFMSDIVRSAPLHDIGKINIPDNVLNKPGKLTAEEYEIMKTHTTAGEKIMEKAIKTVEGENYLKEAKNMATYHHERWDGKGYPEGLHGEVIPLSARITAVADVFDALASPRVYKPAFPLEEALAMIQEGSGTQFDPKCVEAFMESIPEVKVILRKYNENA